MSINEMERKVREMRELQASSKRQRQRSKPQGCDQGRYERF